MFSSVQGERERTTNESRSVERYAHHHVQTRNLGYSFRPQKEKEMQSSQQKRMHILFPNFTSTLHFFFFLSISFLSFIPVPGAGRSSEVERSLMVRWVVGSILHGVDPLSYFSFQPVLHDWCNKGRGMYYPVYGMVHIKEPLLLIGKSSPCGGSGFPLSLSEWSLTICLTPYNRR